MGACAFEDKALSVQFVDQNPIRFNMAVSSANIVADEFVIPVNPIQGFAGNQCSGKDLEFV